MIVNRLVDTKAQLLVSLDNAENPHWGYFAPLDQLTPLEGRELATIQAMVALGVPLTPELTTGELT